MSVCCIGGVCIPYSAFVPLLLWGLKWLLQQVVAAGLFPKTWQTRLESILVQSKGSSSKSSSCCEPTTPGKSHTCSSSSSLESKQQKDGSIRKLESEQDYEAFVHNNNNGATTTIKVIKFTADWCGPCKAIHPVYAAHATAHATQLTCAVADVDELDEIASTLRVGILPTFVAFSANENGNATEQSRYTGSSETALEEWMTNLVPVAAAVPSK